MISKTVAIIISVIMSIIVAIGSLMWLTILKYQFIIAFIVAILLASAMYEFIYNILPIESNEKI